MSSQWYAVEQDGVCSWVAAVSFGKGIDCGCVGFEQIIIAQVDEVKDNQRPCWLCIQAGREGGREVQVNPTTTIAKSSVVDSRQERSMHESRLICPGGVGS